MDRESLAKIAVAELGGEQTEEEWRVQGVQRQQVHQRLEALAQNYPGENCGDKVVESAALPLEVCEVGESAYQIYVVAQVATDSRADYTRISFYRELSIDELVSARAGIIQKRLLSGEPLFLRQITVEDLPPMAGTTFSSAAYHRQEGLNNLTATLEWLQEAGYSSETES